MLKFSTSGFYYCVQLIVLYAKLVRIILTFEIEGQVCHLILHTNKNNLVDLSVEGSLKSGDRTSLQLSWI